MRHTRMTMSTMVPSKTTGDFISRRVIAFLKECGLSHQSIIVKCDQETMLTSIMDNVKKIQVANGSPEQIIPEYAHHNQYGESVANTKP